MDTLSIYSTLILSNGMIRAYTLAGPLPILPLLPRTHLTPPPWLDPVVYTDNSFREHVRYTSTHIPVTTGAAAALIAAHTTGRKTSDTSILYDMVRVNVPLQLADGYNHTELLEWKRDEDDGKKGPYNKLPFHVKWHTMIRDYDYYPTGVEYYKKHTLKGDESIHKYVSIFTSGDGPNSLEWLIKTAKTLQFSADVFFCAVAAVAAQAWFAINNRYMRYNPVSSYSTAYPPFIVRLHESRDLSLVRVFTMKKNTAVDRTVLDPTSCVLNSTNESHKECLCCQGDLYDVASVSTLAEYVGYVMARVCRWESDYCAPYLKIYDHHIYEKTAKQGMLWLSTTNWTCYPVDGLYQRYNSCLMQIPGEGGNLVKITDKKTFRARNMRGRVTKKVNISKKGGQYADYCLPTFYGHLFGRPNEAVLRGFGDNRVAIVALDVSNYLGICDSKKVEVELKKYLLESKSAPTTSSSTTTTSTESKKRKVAASTSTPPTNVKFEAIMFRRFINCVDKRYCVKSPTYLMPPVCLLPHLQVVDGADLYDESSPSWLSIEYIIWCVKNGTDLFKSDGGNSSSATIKPKTKWPIIICDDDGEKKDTAVDFKSALRRIMIHDDIYVVVDDDNITTQELHVLTECRYQLTGPYSGDDDYCHLMINIYNALHTIACDYSDVICTLAKLCEVDISDDINISKFLRRIRRGKILHEIALKERLYSSPSDKKSKSTSIFPRLLQLGYSVLQYIALNWDPNRVHVLEPIPGLGILKPETIRAELPRMPDDNEELQALRVANAGGYLTAEDLKDINSNPNSEYIERVAELLKNERREWYKNLWEPLLSAAHLMMIRPIIAIHSKHGAVVDYCETLGEENELEALARTTMEEYTNFMEKYPNKVANLIQVSDSKDPTMQHYLRYMQSIMSNDPMYANETKELRMAMARSSEEGSLSHGIDANETYVWFSCYDQLRKWFDRPVCPVTEDLLKMYYMRFCNDMQYMALTTPYTSASNASGVANAMKNVHTPAVRVALLLDKMSRDHKTAGGVIQTCIYRKIAWDNNKSDPILQELRDAIFNLKRIRDSMTPPPLPPPPPPSSPRPPPPTTVSSIAKSIRANQLSHVTPATAVASPSTAVVVMATAVLPKKEEEEEDEKEEYSLIDDADLWSDT